MNYEIVIVGGGASGLFLGALLLVRPGSGVILEAAEETGKKLLVTGGGRCNFTHEGDIRDFIRCYGENGGKIRSALYRFNNVKMREFFWEMGIASFSEADGRVFPEAGGARGVRDRLLARCRNNGWKIITKTEVRHISTEKDVSIKGRDSGLWHLETRRDGEWQTFAAENLVIAGGGCSWKDLGRGGSLLRELTDMGISVEKVRPALVPLFLKDDPFRELAGITVSDVILDLGKKGSAGKADIFHGSLLFTHQGISGPAALNASSQIDPGMELTIRFRECIPEDAAGIRKSMVHFAAEKTGLPERLCACLIRLAGGNPDVPASQVHGKVGRRFFQLVNGVNVVVSETAGMEQAMGTRGGVSLTEMDCKSFSVKKFPGLFVIGEALDVLGETGGYNLQFAFSSAAACAAFFGR